jgi:hypothetical protein
MAHYLRAGLIGLLLVGWMTAAAAATRSIQESTEHRQVHELCEEIGNKLGSVSINDCHRQGLRHTGHASVLGRPLALKEYPPTEIKDPLGRILVIGGIHGDEYSSVSVVFKWMDILNLHHSGLFHWHFLPLSNPDGLLRRESQRQNERGVDLNRNFPTADWRELAHRYWETRTQSDPRRYPGPHEASEPEIRYLVDEINSFRPDIIISMHAPYGVIDHDGPPKAPERIGHLTLRRLGVFPGSLGNYGGVDLQIPVVTVELPHAGIMPTPRQVSVMWTDLVAWLIRERRTKLAAQ